jgi:hypothetical protein
VKQQQQQQQQPMTYISHFPSDSSDNANMSDADKSGKVLFPNVMFLQSQRDKGRCPEIL